MLVDNKITTSLPNELAPSKPELQGFLEAREQRLWAMIEHSAEAIALFDQDGKILYGSQSTSHILGYALADFVGQDSSQFIHPSDRARAKAAFRRSLLKPDVGVATEVRFRCADGTWRWLAGTFTNRLDNPDIRAVIANYHDASQEAEALEKRDEQYRTLLDNLPSVLVAQIDLEMRFSVVGGTLLNNLEPQTLDVFESSKYLQKLYQRALAGQYVEEEFSDHAKRLKIQVIPLYDATKQVIGATVLVLDITDLYMVQIALSESEVRFQAVFEQAKIGMVVLDMDGSWRRINPAFATMLGYTPSQLLQLKNSDISHPDEHQKDTVRFLELPEQGQLQYEKRFIAADGAVVWGKVYLSIIQNGTSRSMFKQIENITAAKQNELHIQQLNFELEQRLQRLSALREIDTALVSSLDLSLTLGVVLQQIRKQLGAQAASVLLYYPESLSLRFYVGQGYKSQHGKTSSVRLGRPVSGLVGLDRMPMVVPDIFAREIHADFKDFLEAEGLCSYVGLPLLAKGELLGVIEIFHSCPLEPSGEIMEYLSILASQAALGIENTRVLRALQYSNTELAMAYDETIEGWSRALDLRDKETEGHSRRVTEMTVRLAREMGITESEIVHMRRGALLHDIGKMGVPDEILLKPGKLSDQEWVIMRRHPDFAHELLAPIGFLSPALDIPYAHHEKWDGTGYPRGLSGHRIPLPARIFAVVDVWDALKSDRPYRKGWTTNRITQHILESSGTHFDPKVVGVFLGVLAQQELLQTDLEDLFLTDYVVL